MHDGISSIVQNCITLPRGIESDHLLFEFAIDWSDRGTLIDIIMNALRGKSLQDGTASLYEG